MGRSLTQGCNADRSASGERPQKRASIHRTRAGPLCPWAVQGRHATARQRTRDQLLISESSPTHPPAATADQADSKGERRSICSPSGPPECSHWRVTEGRQRVCARATAFTSNLGGNKPVRPFAGLSWCRLAFACERGSQSFRGWGSQDPERECSIRGQHPATTQLLAKIVRTGTCRLFQSRRRASRWSIAVNIERMTPPMEGGPSRFCETPFFPAGGRNVVSSAQSARVRVGCARYKAGFGQLSRLLPPSSPPTNLQCCRDGACPGPMWGCEFIAQCHKDRQSPCLLSQFGAVVGGRMSATRIAVIDAHPLSIGRERQGLN